MQREDVQVQRGEQVGHIVAAMPAAVLEIVAVERQAMEELVSFSIIHLARPSRAISATVLG